MLEYTVALAGVLVATAVLFLWSGRRKRYLLSKIPTPPCLPILGVLMDVMCPTDDLFIKVQKWGREIGPIIYTPVPGMREIIVSGPDEIQVILNSQENLAKGKTYSFIQPWLATGLLTSTGDKWRSRRKMLTPAFNYKILEGFVPVFNANSTILVERLRNHLQDDYVEIDDFVTLCTLDVICETVMGTSVNAQKGEGTEYIRAVKRLCELFMIRVYSPWLYSDVVWKLSSSGREEKQVLKVLQDFSTDVIRKKRKEHESRNTNVGNEFSEAKKKLSFLEMLLEMSDEGRKLTDEDIREEVNTFMFAGHDTTAAAICWTLLLLATHQGVQEKAASEQSDIFGSEEREPTVSDIANMIYLDMVIKEALRLFPSVPAYARYTETEMKLGEYTIPVGMNLTMYPMIVHRNPQLYPDPDKFDPERFSPEQSAGRHPYAYLPFSAGSRNCIGQKFARLEEKYVISAILRNFVLEPVTKLSDVILMPDIVLKPKTPLRIKFSARV